MRVTYICNRCGAIIGSLRLTGDELQQIGLEPSDADQEAHIIESAPTGALFVYSLCGDCVDALPIHEDERTCPGKQG